MIRILLLLSVVWTFAGARGAEADELIGVTAAQREALGVVVGSLEPRARVSRPHLPGRVVLPNSRSRLITARSAGILLEAVVAVGEAVTEGQALARFESPSLVALQREYLEALSQVDLARSTARRESELAAEGIIAGRRAEESAAFLREAEARLDEREQALALADMEGTEISALRRLRRLQPMLTLRAPLAGIVLEQYASPGERLETGGALYRIGDPRALMVEVHVPVSLASALVAGTPFSLPDQAAQGRVVAVGGEVHPLDQGVLVRGELESKQGAPSLRPGQFVRVQFETSPPSGFAYAVSSTAIVHADRRAWVFREVETGFVAVPVEVVGGAGHEAVIVGELGAGASVAIRGTAALKAHWLESGGPS